MASLKNVYFFKSKAIACPALLKGSVTETRTHIFFLAILFLIFCLPVVTLAQAQPFELQRDTTEVDYETSEKTVKKPRRPELPGEHSPRRAALYSAVLPGLGQAYNKKYWKIPILYGGGAVLVSVINFNHNLYVELRSSYFQLLNSGEQTIEFRNSPRNAAFFTSRIERYRRDRDYFIIISGLVYLLNIADAMVDAHLKSFDLGDDLSLQFKPSGGVTDNNVMYGGFSLTLNIK